MPFYLYLVPEAEEKVVQEQRTFTSVVNDTYDNEEFVEEAEEKEPVKKEVELETVPVIEVVKPVAPPVSPVAPAPVGPLHRLVPFNDF